MRDLSIVRNKEVKNFFLAFTKDELESITNKLKVKITHINKIWVK